MEHFKEMNEEYAKWFVHKPARTCVAVKELPFGVEVSRPEGWLGDYGANVLQIEIEAIALQ